MAEYPWRVLKSLERQISELWKSRGLEVLNESFEPLEDGEAEVRARLKRERQLDFVNYITKKLGLESAHIALHHSFSCTCPTCIKFWSELRQKLLGEGGEG